MRFKVGDKVQAKSKEWYYKNKNSYGLVSESNAHYAFIPEMAGLCGETLTISDVETLSDSYRVEESTFKWTDSMLEDVVASSLIKGNTPFSTGELKANADALFAIKSEEASKLPLYSDTQQDMQHVLDSMKDLLVYKNNKYGNSALEPMDVFTRHVCDQNTAGLNSILVRLDDKLKRIQNAEELRKNDCSDLIGYLTLLCVDQEWTDFSEFKD